jgi:hypothetical protein
MSLGYLATVVVALEKEFVKTARICRTTAEPSWFKAGDVAFAVQLRKATEMQFTVDAADSL